MPHEIMLAGHLALTDRATLGAAMPELFGEQAFPPPLDQYQTALQPSIPPAGVAWQQEVIFDTIAVRDDDVQAEMMTYYEQARTYDTALSVDRIKASDAYRGKEFGDEEPGRSRLVLTTVRDTIRATMLLKNILICPLCKLSRIRKDGMSTTLRARRLMFKKNRTMRKRGNASTPIF